MIDLKNINQKDWFKNLTHQQKELLQQSLFLLEDMKQHKRQFFDYSFIVMPAAKAYEGFIKDVLLRLKLISQNQYSGTRFRVGKSLNPELENIPRLKKEALYNELTQIFGNNEVPKLMWETWRVCRNQIFHYFPRKIQAISLAQAEIRVRQVIKTIRFILTHPQYKI